MPLRPQGVYSPQFRREAVARIRATGRSIHQVATELNIPYVSLRAWRKQEQVDLDDSLTNRELAGVRTALQKVDDDGAPPGHDEADASSTNM